PALVAWLNARAQSCRIQTLSITGDKRRYRFSNVLLFSALWVLAEWLRSWLFSGFPWLLAGYSQIGWPLAGFAPLVGIYGVSLVTALTGSCLFLLWQSRGRSISALITLTILWVGGYASSGISWTSPQGPVLKVAAIQGNVALADKWVAANRGRIRNTYLSRSLPLRDRDLIVWPEAALPEASDRLPASLLQTLRKHPADFVIGVVEVNPVDRRQYFNSALLLGRKTQLYRKRHLVPFGEFLPLPGLLGWLIDYLKIPMSNFSAGASGQAPLSLAGTKVAIDICYEDAFADEIAKAAVGSTLLINLSEDAWFGDSLAPHQRLEMARMRSLETGRPMLRAANTGPSAIIDANGRVIASSPQFVTTVLTGKLQPRSGLTLFMRTGSTPLLLGLLALVLLVLARRLLQKSDQKYIGQTEYAEKADDIGDRSQGHT
ncbi:MAG TPA: apolipoprotein N-acyltransferase, partial [Gammaproteobacteria bacterium]|nr:apolipoprotein N-acyltransferase [Gammaproteobacteria bacterium]